MKLKLFHKQKWEITNLSSEVKFLSGGTPNKGEEKYWGGEIPWVSSGEMKDCRISETALNVTKEGVVNGTRAVPKNTTLVVVRGMSLAKEFRVSITTKLMTFNQDVKAVIPSKKLDSIFLFYYLKSQSNPIRDSASEAAHGTKKLDMPVLEQWPVPLPSIEIQQKIGAILWAYDDLIENNKRRIALLESMAEEIYREWFVRFRFPGYKTAKFEKGLPKGGKLKKFRDIISYYIGGGWGDEDESPTFTSGAYVIRGTDIPQLAKGDYSKRVYRYHKTSNLKSRRLKENDFIFEVSGGSKNQLLGRNLMLSRGLLSFFENNVMCASFCKQIRFDSEQVSSLFMKYYLKLYYECDLVGIYQVQSTGISNYQFESFLNYQTVWIPDQALLKKFDEVIKPIIEQQEALSFSNLKLEESMKSMLPRLVSGKLSIEDLDIQLPPSMLEEDMSKKA